MSTHNICFSREIRKISCGYPFLSVAMSTLLRSCRTDQFTSPHFLLGMLSPLRGQPVIVHILSPETDNCPSRISERETITMENTS